ncbi:MAG: hypothetical protein HQM06_12805 [Magnetococcales bacterium]|nr:hypothetical protein [Magnetococcales bacterium]
MEEISQLAHLLQQLHSQGIGNAHLAATTWLQRHPEQLPSFQIMARILLNVSQQAVAADKGQTERYTPSARTLQQIAQADRLNAWLNGLQRRQQQQAEQGKQNYHRALRRWRQQIAPSRQIEEAVG